MFTMTNPLSRLSGDSIKVLVGSNQELFTVHKNLICASSPFFERAMSGEWAESATQTIEMPDDEPGIFALYIYWLYYNKLPTSNEGPTSSGHDSEFLHLNKE